jgi:DNA-directed RNA polymerase subunit M/transcription elongation factor TFIIS
MAQYYRTTTLAQLTALGLAPAAATIVERSCYNAAIAENTAKGQSLLLDSREFIYRYEAITCRVCLHLDRQSAAYVDGLAACDLKKIGFMTSAELNPAANAHIREEIAVRSAQKIKLKTSTAYRCKKCGKNCTTYEEYQGRSGDEQSNFSFKCLVCGHCWHT